MRSKLQYIYSISVFMGVLVAFYLMMSKEESARIPFQALQTTPSRVEASSADPALQSLIDIEYALKSMRKDKPTAQKRNPSFNKLSE